MPRTRRSPVADGGRSAIFDRSPPPPTDDVVDEPRRVHVAGRDRRRRRPAGGRPRRMGAATPGGAGPRDCRLRVRAPRWVARPSLLVEPTEIPTGWITVLQEGRSIAERSAAVRSRDARRPGILRARRLAERPRTDYVASRRPREPVSRRRQCDRLVLPGQPRAALVVGRASRSPRPTRPA